MTRRRRHKSSSSRRQRSVCVWSHLLRLVAACVSRRCVDLGRASQSVLPLPFVISRVLFVVCLGDREREPPETLARPRYQIHFPTPTPTPARRRRRRLSLGLMATGAASRCRAFSLASIVALSPSGSARLRNNRRHDRRCLPHRLGDRQTRCRLSFRFFHISPAIA